MYEAARAPQRKVNELQLKPQIVDSEHGKVGRTELGIIWYNTARVQLP